MDDIVDKLRLPHYMSDTDHAKASDAIIDAVQLMRRERREAAEVITKLRADLAEAREAHDVDAKAFLSAIGRAETAEAELTNKGDVEVTGYGRNATKRNITSVTVWDEETKTFYDMVPRDKAEVSRLREALTKIKEIEPVSLAIAEESGTLFTKLNDAMKIARKALS